uniref:DUF1985 domain-containing protein n=1 Tax=Brassica oleracea var. oleracea TaxID=109376 RepID=A0A0D3CEL6_BRAOL
MSKATISSPNFQTKKKDIPGLSRRIHTLGEEPPTVHSISYHTCWTLHTALKKALHDDEYEELKESKLGVFIKFSLLEFENLIGLNCEYIEDLERLHCVVTKEPNQNGLGRRLPEFSKKDFAKANWKSMRDKMAVDIFQELPDAHEFENKDNDANLGVYEG